MLSHEAKKQILSRITNVPAKDLILQELPHLYSANVTVSASKNLMQVSNWLLAGGKAIDWVFARIVFGAGVTVIEQDLNLFGDTDDFLVTPRYNHFDLKFTINSLQVASESRILYNPDLAYNVPLTMRFYGKVLKTKEDILLCDLRKWVDISTAADKRFELVLASHVRISEPDDLTSVRVVVDKCVEIKQ